MVGNDGLELESDQSRYSSLSGETGTLQKIVKTQRQIAKLAGRFKQIAERKRRSKAKCFGEITTIERKQQSRLLPSELKVGRPGVISIVRSWLLRPLAVIKTSGKEKQSRGP